MSILVGMNIFNVVGNVVSQGVTLVGSLPVGECIINILTSPLEDWAHPSIVTLIVSPDLKCVKGMSASNPVI